MKTAASDNFKDITDAADAITPEILEESKKKGKIKTEVAIGTGPFRSSRSRGGAFYRKLIERVEETGEGIVHEKEDPTQTTGPSYSHDDVLKRYHARREGAMAELESATANMERRRAILAEKGMGIEGYAAVTQEAISREMSKTV